VAMLEAAKNESPSPLGGRWPRGSERRHFRGVKCVGAVRWLQHIYPAPEAPIRSLLSCRTENHVIERVKRWPMFGPWAGFKAADLFERVVGHPLQFNPNIGLLYAEPRAGLEMLAVELGQSPRVIYENLVSYFSAYKAPPRDDRPCGAAEVESILCKFKSMRGGHYFVGKDIKEVRHALQGWGTTAANLLRHLPNDSQAAE
jgi:Alpha-glutamyl/putrescinyl thymine pyrophosphorylase clade 2